MKSIKPDQFLFIDEYKKEVKRDNKKHKQLRDQRKSKRLVSWE